jgi:replicative DNA helicase
MSASSSLAATALRRLASALEQMSNEELARLNDPGTEIEIKVTRRRSKDEITTKASFDIADTVTKLTGAASRSDASKFLDENFGTKKALEQVARHLDVVVSKQDKAETLRDKIIEATVGARLRSEAIQGVTEPKAT